MEKKKDVQKSIIIKHSNSKICGKKPVNVNSSKLHLVGQLGIKASRLVI